MILTRKRADLKDFLKKNQFEKEFWGQNRLVCGIDEVGRGCLAGPLVTAAVILPLNKTNPLLKDSKILTHAQRLKALSWIQKHCWYGIGVVHHRLIDHHNIYQATLISMKRALLHAFMNCPEQPAAILIDAMPLDLSDTSYREIPVHYFPKAEKKSSSIAAASIVAKVKRDAIMSNFESIFPGFYFSEHKGYSTQKHMDSLKTQRPSLIHRNSFLRNTTSLDESKRDEEQQSFC